MILNHLSRLMGERRMNIKELAQAARLSYTSVHGWYHDRVDRYDRGTLDALCTALGVQVSDLLEHRPDEEDKA